VIGPSIVAVATSVREGGVGSYGASVVGLGTSEVGGATVVSATVVEGSVSDDPESPPPQAARTKRAAGTRRRIMGRERIPSQVNSPIRKLLYTPMGM